EPVAHAVRYRDGFLLGIERNHRQHRPEDLLLSDPHRWRRVAEDRRLDPCVSGGRLPSAGRDAHALLRGDREVAEHLLDMPRMDHRADLRIRIERMPDAYLASTLDDPLDETVVDRALHEEPA